MPIRVCFVFAHVRHPSHDGAGGWRPQRSERLVALGQFLPGNGQSMSTTEGLLQCLAATQSPDASTRQQAHSLPADAFIALRRLLA